MCYTVPIASAIVTTAIYAKTRNQKLLPLNLMLYGGSLFGFIDHLWNNELLLISDNLLRDLMLGVTITAAIFACWGISLMVKPMSRKLKFGLR